MHDSLPATRRPRRWRLRSAATLAAAAAITAGTAIPAVASAQHPARTTVNLTTLPTVYSGYHEAPINLPSSLGTIESLNIPVAGNYVIFAKLTVWNGQNIDDTLTCQLVAGADVDRSDTVLTGNSVPYANYAAQELNIVHTFSSPGSVQLQCTGYGVTTTASWIRITAIHVGTVSNVALP